MTPSIRSAGKVFQYMVTGTTTGDWELLLATSAFAFSVLGESSKCAGDAETFKENSEFGRHTLGGVALNSVNKSIFIFLSEAKMSASVKSSDRLLK